MAKPLKEIRILIADGESLSSKKLGDYLAESGFSVKVVSNNLQIQKNILEFRPHYIFIDLMFPGFYAQNCLQFLKERHLLGPDGIRVVVTSNHNSQANVMACLKEGADDFLVKPLKSLEVLNRLLLLVKSKKFSLEGLDNSGDSRIHYYFQIIELLVKAASQQKDVSSLRFELIQMLSLAVKAVRTSVITWNPESQTCRVISSSDDKTLTDFQLDLQKYPELQYVLRTGKPLFIENIGNEKSLAMIHERVKTIQFNSMIVFPVHHGTQLVGCLSIRMPEAYKKLSVWDVKVAKIAAQLVAMTWKFKDPVIKNKAA